MKPNREIQPPLTIPSEIRVPLAEKVNSEHGIDLYQICIEDHNVLRVSLVFNAGVKFQQHPFEASSTLNMLSEGTQKYSAEELAEIQDYYGLNYEASMDRDYSVISVCTLPKFLDKALELIEQMVIYPKFDQSDLDRYAAKRKQQIQIRRQKGAFRAQELFAEALFGKNHPYGCSYEAELYDKLNSEMLVEFHRRHYIAQECFAVCSGNVKPEHTTHILELLNKIPSHRCATEHSVMPEIVQTKLLTESRPEALQSAIRMGRMLFTRNHSDFNGMQIVSTILGGYFGSRLISNLREERGYTYGIFSTMVNLAHNGYLAISTEVAAEATEDSLTQIRYEMSRLREELVSEQELTAVKNIMIGDIMRILDGPFGIADVTIENIQNGNDNSSVIKFFEEIKNITPERVRDLARKYLTEEDFITTIVGRIP